MALLPARNILDGTALPVTSQMKTALGSLRDFLAGLLGTDSTDTAAARTALGAAKSGANSDITSLTNLTGGALVTGAALLGYTTGSGGSVTQATSKTTAVTLNKPCGTITMHGAALAAGASVYFTVNNTLVDVTDVVLLSGIWGFSPNYRIEIYGMGGDGFHVRVTNISAGSLSEALAFNFAVIKGSSL